MKVQYWRHLFSKNDQMDSKAVRGVRETSNYQFVHLQVVLLLLFVFVFAEALFAQPQDGPAYREFPLIGSRVAMWVVGQLHLMFAAFILGVPIFAVIIEFVGVRTKDPRYDRMAREFIKLCLVAFSTTALLGVTLLFMLISLYPHFFTYMTNIFSPTYLVYVLLFFGETFTLYLYWYTWDRLMNHKWLHLTLGVLLNLIGTAIMFVANAWLTFMTSPAGIEESGALISIWDAINNYTWMPINIHRVIANVAFGGAIVAAYSAVRFITAKTKEDKAHYDWMGYTGNFIAISALIPAVIPAAILVVAGVVMGVSAGCSVKSTAQRLTD